MSSYFSYLFTATKLVLSEKRYLALFILFTIGFLAFLVYIPVTSVPGNDLVFQLSIYTFKDYFLLITLSLLTSLSFSLNIFAILRDFKARSSATLLAQGGGGSLSALIGTIFGTASCSSCVASLFGFLGVGGVLFLIKYKDIITFSAIALMLISLYYTSKRVLGICNIKINSRDR